jgi:hypothetical protein
MKNQEVINALEMKVENKGKMPSIRKIHELLEELGIEHYYYGESTNICESRTGNRSYVNDRWEGKKGKRIVIETETQTIELDSSNSYYSLNSWSLANQILAIIKIKK